MVKADLTRDYYSDLELPPTAEVSEIKRQFKKLALTYHPDRNPGRESEVTAKFQKIQSAHEVLIDPIERAKYDSNRVRPSRYGGQSSGVRGNPWSSAGSAYPPPPKAPTAQRTQRPPPPSTGARKYEKFTTQQQPSYTAFEGAGARTATYQAWEHLRHNQKPTETGPGKSWGAPQPPPRGTPQSGREESNARRHAPPPRAGPGFEEFREANSPRRSQSTTASSRKGFMPSTPGGGDEGPAPMGAYSTDRNKPTVAPEVPPRESLSRERPHASTRPIPNPLKQFQDKAMANEPRISTPYSTHGGEKFNPFESTNVNRSKSTREPPENVDSDFIFRTGSDPNLTSPSRARSFAQRNSPRAPKSATETVNLDSSSESSSDGFLNMNGRPRQSDSKRSSGGATRTAAPPQGTPSVSMDSDTNGQAPRSSRPQAQPQAQTSGETIFSFNVNDDTFSRTRHPSNGFSNSAENISTKFTPEDWDGKFEAGADYFKPIPDQKSRAQSVSRTRGRSPVKVRPVEPKFPQPREAQPPMESPNGTKFSADEWKETFKPQTFMPPPPTPRMAPTPSRKRTGPTTRPTMGNAAVVDDDDNSDEKPLFTGRKNMASTAVSPDPMDVDTPPASHVVPQYATTPKGHLKVNTESSKQAASASQSPIDSESLKVNFDDLRIRDLMSTLAMPPAPQPPILPEAASEYERPTRAAYDDYIKQYAKYLSEWDLFNSKFLLHMVARKNQNDTLKDRRWNEERAAEIYRAGLKEDQAVLKRWTELHEGHELIVKAFLVLRERMKTREEREGASAGRTRPRKKTH